MADQTSMPEELTGPQLPAHERDATAPASERIKHRAYVGAVLVAFPLLVGAWLVAESNPVDRAARPIFAVCCVVVLALMWRRPLPLRTLERAVLAALMAVHGVKLVAGALMLDLPSFHADLAESSIWMMAVLSLLAFLVHDVRGGLVRALALFVGTSAVAFGRYVPAVLEDPGHAVLLAGLLRLQVGSCVLIVLAFSLAQYKEWLARSQSRAETMAHLAHTDPLTEIPNRRLAFRLLAKEVAVARRFRRPLAVILIDVDHFKSVNDRFGHQCGDEVLRGIAQLMSEVTRQSDVLARWGGEEFLVIATDTGLLDAMSLAGRLQSALTRHSFARVGAVTASFGVAAFRPEELPADLLRRADEALYRAKGGGRNRVEPEWPAEVPLFSPTRRREAAS